MGGTCTIPALVVGANSVIVITATAPITAGMITNTVSITSATVDTFLANNTMAISTKVMVPADLVLTQLVSPALVTPGQPVTYTLIFSNVGAGLATGVVITDRAPLALIGVHYQGRGAVITPTGSLSYTWQVQNLAQHQGGVITLTGIVTPGLAGGSVFTNTATITGAGPETSVANNTSAAGVIIQAHEEAVYLPLILK